MRRRRILGGLLLSLVAPLAAEAQPAGKIARVGYLGGSPREMLKISMPIFLARLQELQFVEGQNLVVEFRHADSQERFRQLAAELARLGVQVIYATNPYAIRGAREATKAIPIVGYDYETDPIAAGFAVSLARPGGELHGKRLELLKELVPGAAPVAVLWEGSRPGWQAAEVAARARGWKVLSLEVRSPGEIEATFRTAADARAGALLVFASVPLFVHAKTAKALGLTIPPSLLQRAGQVIE